MNLISRYAPILFTIALVLCLERLVTLEWSYPYCLNQTDGPAYIVQGMPLPYTTWGQLSLHYLVMPHVYLLNVIILCLLIFPAIRWLSNRIASAGLGWLRNIIGAVGGLFLLCGVAITVLAVSAGVLIPVISLKPYGGSYSDLRPVRFGISKSPIEYCTPSRFWFPDGWHPE